MAADLQWAQSAAGPGPAIAPLDSTGAQLFFPLVAGAYERRPLGIGSHSPFEDWGLGVPQ